MCVCVVKCMYINMDGWRVDRWMDGWMDGYGITFLSIILVVHLSHKVGLFSTGS